MVPNLRSALKMTFKNVDKWTDIIFLAVVKITNVIGLSPKFIVSFYYYCAKDMGPDSFELPVSMWYVRDLSIHSLLS